MAVSAPLGTDQETIFLSEKAWILMSCKAWGQATGRVFGFLLTRCGVWSQNNMSLWLGFRENRGGLLGQCEVIFFSSRSLVPSVLAVDKRSDRRDWCLLRY